MDEVDDLGGIVHDRCEWEGFGAGHGVKDGPCCRFIGAVTPTACAFPVVTPQWRRTSSVGSQARHGWLLAHGLALRIASSGLAFIPAMRTRARCRRDCRRAGSAVERGSGGRREGGMGCTSEFWLQHAGGAARDAGWTYPTADCYLPINRLQNNFSKTAQNSLCQAPARPSIPTTPTIQTRSAPKKVCLLTMSTLLFLEGRGRAATGIDALWPFCF